MSNYYILLGISPAATEDEVKQAYLKLAKIYHPDKNKSPDATKKMAEINLAYETLHDIHRRKKYDVENEIDVQNDKAEQQEGSKAESGPTDDIFCPTCGFKPRPSDRFCSQCGTPFNHGRCIQCNFVNNSGIFVCSICGYIFAPQSNSYEKQEEQDESIQYDLPDNNGQEIGGEELSEIIRCPRCNEINRYSRGSCWHCRLYFDVEEIA